MKCFLNIRNPYFIQTETYSDFDYDYKRFDPSNFKNNDGIYIKADILVFDEKADKHFVAFEPNQIKLADGSNTTFDGRNPDIRYGKGGRTGEEIECRKCHWHWNTNDSDSGDKYVCHNCGYDNGYKYEQMNKNGIYKSGGQIDPDNEKIKNAITHKAGSAGGLLVGKRHSEGGIKAVNKSSNQPLEMEGGEVVITRNAVSDESKREFDGEMLTNRQILSRINESGGGVSFAEGGDVPHKCSCSGKSYKFGGKTMRDNDIVQSINTYYEKISDLTPADEMKKLFAKTLRYDKGGEVYGDGGTLEVMNKRIPTLLGYTKQNSNINSSAIRHQYINFLNKKYFIKFEQLPQLLRAALLMGNQKLVDNYLNR